MRRMALNATDASFDRSPFQELFPYFAIVGLLYRLANSSSVDRFVLKSALLLTVCRHRSRVPPVDIDLAGSTSNEVDHISEVVRSVCNVRTEADASNSIQPRSRSLESRKAQNMRAFGPPSSPFLRGREFSCQIDIGFGDGSPRKRSNSMRCSTCFTSPCLPQLSERAIARDAPARELEVTRAATMCRKVLYGSCGTTGMPYCESRALKSSL